MADMQELIARLEAAEGPSDEIDFDLARWLYANPSMCGALVNYDPELWVIRNGGWTDSLDAALALAERVLPGQEYEITTLYNVARVTLNINHGNDGGPFYGSNVCCNVPLALCAAALKSIQHGYAAAGEVSPNLKAKAQGEGG